LRVRVLPMATRQATSLQPVWIHFGCAAMEVRPTWRWCPAQGPPWISLAAEWVSGPQSHAHVFSGD
jgi:hypothetical protein